MAASKASDATLNKRLSDALVALAALTGTKRLHVSLYENTASKKRVGVGLLSPSGDEDYYYYKNGVLMVESAVTETYGKNKGKTVTEVARVSAGEPIARLVGEMDDNFADLFSSLLDQREIE
jgi:hypothetical protein